MTDSIATLSQENDISIITLDDGKANAFSYDMLTQVNKLLAKVPRDSGALVITAEMVYFQGDLI
jgi:enoyl-CoA hydratase